MKHSKKGKPMSYKRISQLSDPQRQALVNLKNDREVLHISVVDEWTDDRLPCIDVKLDGAHIIKFSIWNTSREIAAAFRFPDSPRAAKIIREVIKAELEKEVEDD